MMIKELVPNLIVERAMQEEIVIIFDNCTEKAMVD